MLSFWNSRKLSVGVPQLPRQIPNSKSSMPRLPSRRMRVILILTFNVLAVLGLSELLLRVFDIPQIRLERSDRRHGYLYDPDLGWIGPANTVTHMNASRPVSLRHNSLGLRDIELNPSAGPTILFLGDSLVYGIDVEAEERFTERLRPELPGVRIVNAGIAGYGTDQEYLQLQRLWPRVEPSVVVLIFSVDSDRIDNSTNYRYFSFKPYLTNLDDRWQFRGYPIPVAPQLSFYNNWFALHFASVRLAILGYSSISNHLVSVPDPTEQLVSMMRDLVEERGAKFLVGLQRQEPALEAFMNSQKIRYTRFDEAERYPEWGGHWTPAGHALVAQRLMTLLAKENVVHTASTKR
jgi:hypothetical protein